MKSFISIRNFSLAILSAILVGALVGVIIFWMNPGLETLIYRTALSI